MNKKTFTIRCLALVTALNIASLTYAADIVVVMAPGAAALSKDQVANLYLGRSTDLTPLDLPESSAVREAFYKLATDRGAAQVKAVKESRPRKLRMLPRSRRQSLPIQRPSVTSRSPKPMPL